MTAPQLTPIEARVLAVLAAESDSCGFGYLSFRDIAARGGRLTRTQIRLACRSLNRKGLAVYGRGLWTESGAMAGSGYAATRMGARLMNVEQPS